MAIALVGSPKGKLRVLSTGFEQDGHQDLSGLRTLRAQAFLSAYPLHEGVPRAARLAPELDQALVVDDAVDDGGRYLVVPEHGPQRLNSRLVVMTTDCRS